MKINPFSNSNPMSFQEATKLSLILSLAQFFTIFLLPYTMSGIQEALSDFCFNTFRFVGVTFFTNFISLSGLAIYSNKEKQEDVNGSGTTGKN